MEMNRLRIGILFFSIFTLGICVWLGKHPIKKKYIPVKHFLELKRQKGVSDDLTMRQAHMLKYYETHYPIPKY